MSKNEEVLDALRNLIWTLDRTGVIDMVDLVEELGVREMDVVVITARKDVNYEKVASYMDNFGQVFLEASRQKISYAIQRLEEITGNKIEKIPAKWGNKNGYILSYVEQEQQP